MKVLYISHQKEDSGYGRWCRAFLKAMRTTNLDISSIALPLGKVTDFKDETENNPITNIDVVIQNVLPHLMSKGSVRCIGGAILESASIDFNYWKQNLEMMDEVWYPHYPLNLYKKEKEVPTPLELNKYLDKSPKLDIKEVNGTYKFYWIGEISKRKNLSGLIKSYYNSFSYSDPVSLIIKCHKSNFNAEQCRAEVNELIRTTANGCKMYTQDRFYPKIIVIPEYWPEEKINALHRYCDCFVSSSHGESINYPMLDALGYNNNVLSTTTFATETYCRYGKIELCASDGKEPCFGQMDTFDWYQTSRELWEGFDIINFGNKMKKIYDSHEKQNNDLSDLSYENIGRIIKGSLEES